jgi:tripeptidyl-peptidase-1
MHYSLLFARLLSLASTFAAARSTSHVEPVENLRRVPEGWKEVGTPAQARRLHFRIAVHQVSGHAPGVEIFDKPFQT